MKNVNEITVEVLIEVLQVLKLLRRDYELRIKENSFEPKIKENSLELSNLTPKESLQIEDPWMTVASFLNKNKLSAYSNKNRNRIGREAVKIMKSRRLDTKNNGKSNLYPRFVIMDALDALKIKYQNKDGRNT